MAWAPLKAAAQRDCDVCGGDFSPHSYQQLRCSDECMETATRRYHAARSRPDRAVPGYARTAHLKRKYGLGEEQFDALLAQQGGGCAICGGLNGDRHLEVDHDHRCCPGAVSCGECVRGLLCGPCNKILGHAKDSTGRLRAAVDYLGSFDVES